MEIRYQKKFRNLKEYLHKLIQRHTWIKEPKNLRSN